MTERTDQPEDIEFPGFDLDGTDRPRESLGRCNCHLGIKCSIHDQPQADTSRTVEEMTDELMEWVESCATIAKSTKPKLRLLIGGALEEVDKAARLDPKQFAEYERTFKVALEAQQHEYDRQVATIRHACAEEIRALGCRRHLCEHRFIEARYGCPIAIADRLEKGGKK